MISKKYIKELELQTIEDVFDYIVESEMNGNYSQCKELVNKLSWIQFKEYIEWLDLSNKYFNSLIKQIKKAIEWRN